MTITKADAAQLLGMKESEVEKVGRVEEGTSVLLFDGSELLIVPKSSPDAQGRHGLMLRRSYGQQDLLPVYDAGEAEDEDEAPAEPEGDDDDAPAEPKPTKRAAKKAAAKKAPAEPEGDDDDA